MSFEQIPTYLQLYFSFFVLVVGACIGSFLNVFVLRSLAEESFVFPPSKCPKCNTPIKWYDNIPVLSYIFLLQGKCRACKEHISIQYPVVEASFALLFLAVFIKFGITLQTLLLWILTFNLVAMFITDIKEQVVFDISSIPMIPLGLIYSFFDISHSGLGKMMLTIPVLDWSFSVNSIFVSALVGAVIGFVIFEAFAWLGVLMVGQRAFGEGDGIIAAGMGAWFGWKYLVVILILSLIIQMIVGIPIILFNMFKNKDYESLKAFGMMLLAVVVALFNRAYGGGQNFVVAMIILLLIMGLALWGSIKLLGNMKERQSHTMLPYGPPLILGAFAVMFWGQYLLNNYFSWLN